MTVAADFYAQLITSEHNERPKFVAWVTVLTSAYVDSQNVLASMAALFDLETAVGTQLDAVGVWVGFGRSQNVPGIGFVELPDADYRVLLNAKILTNHYDGTFEQLVLILTQLFPGTGVVVIPVDNQDMSMDLYVVGPPITPLQLALLSGGFLVPKPEGVRINSITVVGANPVFGTDHADFLVNGPDIGAFQ